MKTISKEQLMRLYYDKSISLSVIATLQGMSKGRVLDLFREYGLKKREWSSWQHDMGGSWGRNV